MTERHLRHDPPSETEIAEAIADIDEHIDEAFRMVPAGRTRTVIGVSGTVTTMSALALGLKEYDHRRVERRAHPRGRRLRRGRQVSAHDA